MQSIPQQLERPVVELRSDNTAGVSPEILEAVAAANAGTALAYGGDELTAELESVVREVFEHPTARVFPVTSGTAANALSLSSLCPPWGAVLCHESAHILNSECGSTSLLGGGAVIRGVPGDDFRIAPTRSRRRSTASAGVIPTTRNRPCCRSRSRPTWARSTRSTRSPARRRRHARGLRIHIDGARVANALAALGCSPADLTWRAGVDVLSLGATKNGALSAEAIVAFDDARRRGARLPHQARRPRHVEDALPVGAADHLPDRRAVAAHRRQRERPDGRLAAGLAALGVEFVNRPDVNMLFAALVDDATADQLEAASLLFYRMGRGTIRLVTSWQTTEDDVAPRWPRSPPPSADSCLSGEREAGAAAAATSALNRASCSGRSTIASACHCTPSQNGRDGSSIASTVPSGAVATARSAGAEAVGRLVVEGVDVEHARRR